jgi:Ca2+-binding RTX toxin-like protein
MYQSAPGPNKPPLRGKIGTSGDDVLNGTEDDDTISGLGGNDTMKGGGGNDWLYGGDGSDKLYGGNDSDHLYGQGGGDELYGNAGDDWLYGGEGLDKLYGGSGDDHLYGGGAHGFEGDLLNGGAGADVLHGVDGVHETADYHDSPGAVQVNLGTSKGAGSDAQGDIYYDIECVTGSSFDDVLIGSGDFNVLRGGLGNDQLFGLGDDDRLIGGAGADYLDGGAGNDKIEYGDSAAGVTVNLTTNTGVGGEAQGDIYFSIERVNGSSLDDTIIGNSSGNIISGDGGNDTLFGGGGQDRLYGGKGQDTLTGGTEADTFGFFGAETIGEAPDYIMDFSQTDGDVIDLDSFEGFSEQQPFTFIGTAGFSSAAWQLRFEHVTGDTIISGDTDGDAQADFEIHCVGTINFTENDFLL